MLHCVLSYMLLVLLFQSYWYVGSPCWYEVPIGVTFCLSDTACIGTYAEYNYSYGNAYSSSINSCKILLPVVLW